MAILLEANYSKKLGLPGYSSHQYSVTIKTEVSDLSQAPAESSRLYDLLQSCVDRDIQKTGYLPQGTGNGNRNGNNQSANDNVNGRQEYWACSPKQRDLILKIVEEHKFDKNAVEQLAQDRFGKSVRALNKLEASALIDELISQTGGNPRRGHSSRPTPANTR